MDGFFVAKFKVEKRKKPVAATKEEEEAPQMKLNEEGELVEEKRTAFNDDEDEDIIKGQSSLYQAKWKLT
jgi:ribosomal RNA methyltransferase Nop2